MCNRPFREAHRTCLHEPLRQLDTVVVPVTLADDLKVDVKVWIVRESGSGIDDLEEEDRALVVLQLAVALRDVEQQQRRRPQLVRA